MADSTEATETHAPVTPPPMESSPPAEAKNTDTGTQDHMIPKSRFDEINEQLKSQKATAAKLEKQIKEFQKAQDTAEQAKLEEKGEYQKAKEQLALKLAETESKLETIEPLKQKIELYEKKFGELLAGQKEGLPDYILDLLKDKDPLDQLAWLSQHKAQLAGQQPGQRQTGSQQAAALATFNPAGGNGAQETDQQRVARLNHQAGRGQSVFG